MKLTEGIKVCISVESLYNREKDLLYGHIEYTEANEPENGDDNYFDLYNEDGELACMDGEEVIVTQIDEDLITFRHDYVDFRLSYEEAEIAIYE